MELPLDFFLDGTSLRSMGLVPTDDGNIDPAPVNISWDEPAYSIPVDTSEFVTGHPTFGLQDSNYTELVVMDISRKEELWRWLMGFHGLAVEMATTRRNYNGEMARWYGRISVSDVSEIHDNHDVFRLEWERGPWLYYADGEAHITGVAADWQIGPYDPGSTTSVLGSFDDVSPTEAAWYYSPLLSPPVGYDWSCDAAVYWTCDTVPDYPRTQDVFDAARDLAAEYGLGDNYVVAWDDWGYSPIGTTQDVWLSNREPAGYYAIGYILGWGSESYLVDNYSLLLGIVYHPDGMFTLHVTKTNPHSFGDADFDYDGYYELVDGILQPIEQGSTPEFSEGSFFVAAEDLNVVTAEDVVFVENTFYGSYADIVRNLVIDNRTVMPSSPVISSPFALKLHDTTNTYEDLELPAGTNTLEWDSKALGTVEVSVPYQPDVYSLLDEEPDDWGGFLPYSDAYSLHPLAMAAEAPDDWSIASYADFYWARDEDEYLDAGIYPISDLSRIPAWEPGRLLVYNEEMIPLDGYAGPFVEGVFSRNLDTIDVSAVWERADV